MTRPLPPRFDYALVVASVTDGDTIRGHVTREIRIDLDDDFTDTITRRQRDPRGVPLRFLWVNTPEREDRAGWTAARDDTAMWLASHVGRLRVETHGREERGGRILADIYVDSDRGNTLSQYLIRDRGWPPYLGS